MKSDIGSDSTILFKAFVLSFFCNDAITYSGTRRNNRDASHLVTTSMILHQKQAQPTDVRSDATRARTMGLIRSVS